MTVHPKRGYDLWADSYDETPNPLVTLDRLHTIDRLAPKQGETVLDAGCGTGGHFDRLLAAGTTPVGVDLSVGMLRRARTRGVPVIAADLGRPLPFVDGAFDAVLCSLVSEHLSDPTRFFSEMRRVLGRTGRMVLSGLHPDRAADGVAANFVVAGERVQMAAHQHSISDFVRASSLSGFEVIAVEDFVVDQPLIDAVAKADKYRGLPLLFVMTSRVR